MRGIARKRRRSSSRLDVEAAYDPAPVASLILTLKCHGKPAPTKVGYRTQRWVTATLVAPSHSMTF
jgi:hypothetical protein